MSDDYLACTHNQGATGVPDIKILQGSVITIELPGLTAIRIDTATRTIAVDGISGGTDEPCLPDWFITDLRNGTYGDFHQLRPKEDCADADCRGSGQHNALYPHYHETVEDVADCQPCIDRAADLRHLADV